MQAIDLKTNLRARGFNLSVIARQMSVNKSTVTRWASRGVPVGRVVDIERLTGIPREELRPDIFSPASSEQEVAR